MTQYMVWYFALAALFLVVGIAAILWADKKEGKK